MIEPNFLFAIRLRKNPQKKRSGPICQFVVQALTPGSASCRTGSLTGLRWRCAARREPAFPTADLTKQSGDAAAWRPIEKRGLAPSRSHPVRRKRSMRGACPLFFNRQLGGRTPRLLRPRRPVTTCPPARHGPTPRPDASWHGRCRWLPRRKSFRRATATEACAGLIAASTARGRRARAPGAR